MTEIDIKMSAIYHASHDVLPEKAVDFNVQAGNISAAIEPLAQQVSLAGNHPVGTDLADVAVELFGHLRTLTRTFNESATALDRIADDFVKVDGDAAAWFQHHRQYVGEPDLPSLPTPPEV